MKYDSYSEVVAEISDPDYDFPGDKKFCFVLEITEHTDEHCKYFVHFNSTDFLSQWHEVWDFDIFDTDREREAVNRWQELVNYEYIDVFYYIGYLHLQNILHNMLLKEVSGNDDAYI